jgi:hypothetical protein
LKHVRFSPDRTANFAKQQQKKTHLRIYVLGGPVIDASTAVCQYLTGSSSCGWSDKVSITATVTSDSRPNGPY